MTINRTPIKCRLRSHSHTEGVNSDCSRAYINEKPTSTAAMAQADNSELASALTRIRVLEELLTNQVKPLPTPSVASEPVSSPRIHVPKFNITHPHLWFAQLENAFRTNGITDDLQMFSYATNYLEGEALTAVADLLTNPPTENRFQQVKTRIMARFAESAETKLRRMLHGGAVDGKRPSVILAEMKELASNQCSEAVMRSLFMEKILASIRPILLIHESSDLETLARTADKMLEITQ